MPADFERALTGVADADTAVPDIVSALVEQAAQAKRYMRQIVVLDTSLQGSPGDSITINKIGGLDAVEMADDKASVDGQVLPVDGVQIALKRLEATVDITRDLKQQAYINIMDAATQALGDAIAAKEDSKIIEAAIAGAGHNIFVNGAANEDALTATDTLDTDAIKAALEVLESNNAPGPYWLVIHPHQKGALWKDEQFVDASKYGSDRVVATGEIGEYLGARVVATTNIPHAANANTVEVYRALALSPRSLAEALGEDITVLDADMLPAGKLATRYTATMSMGAAVLNAPYTAVIHSA